MNDLEKKEFSDTYQKMLDAAPKDVRDFLWSDAYKGLIEGIAKYCHLTDKQKEVVSDTFFDLIIGINEEEDVKRNFTLAGIPETIQQTIVRLGYDYFVEPAAALAENQIETDAFVEPTLSTTSLNSITDRLKQASITVPIVPDRTLDELIIRPSVETTAPAEAPARPAIDPYHEQIEP